jgi:hypothetical protein
LLVEHIKRKKEAGFDSAQPPALQVAFAAKEEFQLVPDSLERVPATVAMQ